ncbi:MAG TPA: M48 family metalloprotease, partial [Burkholderiaceae bacterium]|nr:M48 family metalloprotease [Burkholderiaceae bacterium]
ARCGFASKGLFVMDGSRRSAHGNAYFTGFGRSKRIVFFDTLLSRLDPDEIEAVLAHELGHFHHRHVPRRIALMLAASLAGLWLLGWLSGQGWFYQGLGVTPAAGEFEAAALVLFLLVLPVFGFPLRPLVSRALRQHEFQADAYAATHARPESLVSALVKLYEDNASTLTPDRLHSAFYDSHPPASLRIGRLQEAR